MSLLYFIGFPFLATRGELAEEFPDNLVAVPPVVSGFEAGVDFYF